MSNPRYPSLYQINTRVWLTELSSALGKRATLDDIPDAELDRFAELGFDWVWFLSVWQTGPAAQVISRANPGWRKEFQDTLPDLKEEDIAGSGFAIQNYAVHRDLGGDAALARLRQRMQKRGLKLMLDFVPNHMAPDHPWIDEHPEYSSQCCVRLPFGDWYDHQWRLHDLLENAQYHRDGNELQARGLYVDLAPWRYTS